MNKKNIKNSLLDTYLKYLINIVSHFESHATENIAEFKDEIYNSYNVYVYISEIILHLLSVNYSQLQTVFSNNNLLNNILYEVSNYKLSIYDIDTTNLENLLTSINNTSVKTLFFCELFFPYDFYLSLTKFFEYHDEVTLGKIQSKTLIYEKNFFKILRKSFHI